MPSFGTPFDLYSAYRNINVRLLGHQFILSIDVHEYRNNEEKGSIGTKDGLAEYHALYKKIGKYGHRMGSNLYEIYYPVMTNAERKKTPQTPINDYMTINAGWPFYNVFVGKGSPREIADAIKVAVAFGHAEPTLHSIQAYCDKNIGIDCSGFASNFFGFTPEEAVSIGAKSMAPMSKRVRRLEDVRCGTAIVFTNGKHVALVDSVTNTDRTNGIAYAIDCKVAESTADQMVQGGPTDGLNYTDYVLLVENNKYDPTIFKILRPLAGEPNGFYGKPVFLANWPEFNVWE
jgi:hypothetical protein